MEKDNFNKKEAPFALVGLNSFLSSAKETIGDYAKNFDFGKYTDKDFHGHWVEHHLKQCLKKTEEYLKAFKDNPGLFEGLGKELKGVTDELKGIKDLTGKALDGMKNTSIIGEDLGKNLAAISKLVDSAEGRVKKAIDAFVSLGAEKGTAPGAKTPASGISADKSNFFGNMGTMKDTVGTTLAGLAQEDVIAIEKHIKTHKKHLGNEAKLASWQTIGQTVMGSGMGKAIGKAATDGDVFTLIGTAAKAAVSAMLSLGGTYAKYALQKTKMVADVISQVGSNREKSMSAPNTNTQASPAPTKELSPGGGGPGR